MGSFNQITVVCVKNIMKYVIPLTLLLSHLSLTSPAIIKKHEASNFLSTRSKRSNSGEEIYRGADLNRECALEDCDQEEFDEIFENFVKEYRGMNLYRENLYRSYLLCKDVESEVDVKALSKCIKQTYGEMPMQMPGEGDIEPVLDADQTGNILEMAME